MKQHLTTPATDATKNSRMVRLAVDDAEAICPVCDGRGSRDVSDVSRRQAASVNVPPPPL